MAIKLNFNVEPGKDFFHVFDRTGKYGKKNKCGWGKPNTKLEEVKGAILKIFLPGKETYSSVNVFPYIPNDSCVGYEILPSHLGLETFPPGVYNFSLEIELHTGVIIAEDCFIFYYEPLECCISKKRMQTNLTDVTSDKAKKVIELDNLLKNAKRCACSGKKDCAQEISDYIWTNCGCCC